MKSVRQVLELEPLAYANYHTYKFNEYCTSYSFKTRIPARVLQKSEMLYNWYCSVWKKNENHFLDFYSEYINAGIKNQTIYWDLFADEVEKKIMNNYPSAILDDLYRKHFEKINTKIA